ncbi:uncharacterized protein LODBEIA_P07540 [Lodderomyces beijingensis]|uniref:ATPase expression protein 2, mitochondrial n=1 Tax=Lodderomyces beijingensis TaxID=1775926 RepID=A0ABP0ZHA2_9ASCO
MLTTRAAAKQTVSKSTLAFVRKFIGKGLSRDGSQEPQQETDALAEALNLFTRKPAKSGKSSEVGTEYKPSLFKAFAKGSVDEQMRSRPRTDASNAHQDKNDAFVQNMLRSINMTLNTMSSLDASELLSLDAKQLQAHIKSITDEKLLVDTLDLFIEHERLNFQILGDVLMNPCLRNLSRLPVDAKNFSNIRGIDEVQAVKLKILMLKKHHSLKHPIQIISNLKQNIEVYFSAIKNDQLPRNYERLVWKFTFQYLKQYNESYYVEQFKNLRTSFIIWESTKMSHSRQVAQKILSHHSQELNSVQILFLKVAAALEDKQLRYFSVKTPLDRVSINSRWKCYLIFNSLEKILLHSQQPTATSLLDELNTCRANYIKYASEKGLEELTPASEEIILQQW